MTLDRYPSLDPGRGDVRSTEAVISDDVLVKVFALGPEAELAVHRHENETNVFHVLEGAVTVVSGDEEEVVEAPGIVHHERGTPHGARNETADIVVFSATLSPFPS